MQLNHYVDTLKYKKAEIYSMIAEAEDSLANIDNTFYMVSNPHYVIRVSNQNYLNF